MQKIEKMNKEQKLHRTNDAQSIDTNDDKNLKIYTGDEFKPDLDLKRIVTTMKPERLITILNTIEDEDISLDSTLSFGMQEGLDVTGDLDKSYVRADLIINIQNKEGTLSKYGMEFQTSEDKDMGFRVFVYGLNNCIKDANGIRILPVGTIIYLTTNSSKPRHGTEKVGFKIKRFGVDDIEYNLDNTFFLLYNTINVLAFDFDELKGTPFEIFKTTYLYKYKLNLKMIDNDKKEIFKISNELMEYIHTLEDNERRIATEIIYNLLGDIEFKCNEKDDLKKEAEVMSDIRETLGGKALKEAEKNGIELGIEKGIEQGFEKGIEQGIEKGIEQGFEKGTKQTKIQIAISLLDLLSDLDISLKVGLELEVVENLRQEQNSK